MINRDAAQLSAAIIGLMVIVSVWAYAVLPSDARVAIHFGPDGQPDRWTSAAQGVLFAPLTAIFIWGVFAIVPKIDPKRDGLARSAKAYGALWIAMVSLFAIIHGIIIAGAMGVEINMARPITALMGVLFLILGNYLGKLRPNYTFGIRTRWTLADPEIWDKTHRFSARLMVGSGLVLVVAAFALPVGTVLAVTLVVTIAVIAIGTTGYSYWLWRRRR